MTDACMVELIVQGSGDATCPAREAIAAGLILNADARITRLIVAQCRETAG